MKNYYNLGGIYMFTSFILAVVTLIVLMVVTFIVSIGGVVFLTIGADIIVAIGIIWLIVWLCRNKKGGK